MTCLGSLIGFTNLGDINSHLQAYERNLEDESQAAVANSMLVFLVQGLFSNLEFPYVQFPCVELSGEQMYDPFWESVSRLEWCGFCVLALVSDGLAANRRLLKIHGDSSLFTKSKTCMHLMDSLYSLFLIPLTLIDSKA